MSIEESRGIENAQVSILHETKTKFNHMNASILLASSLLNHKQRKNR